MTAARPTALITGASAGIGRAFAVELASRGYDLVVTARREDRLRALASELSRAHGTRVEVVALDSARPSAPADLMSSVKAQGLGIDLLVNNAGYGLGAKYVATTWPQNADFLQVMVTAVAHLTHLCLPAMIERGHGQIVLISSLAGLLHGSPGSTLYAASKAFLVRFAESLSLELEGTGVTVTAICPGFVMTEFHDVAGTRERVRTLPKPMWADADELARKGVEAALAGTTVFVPGALPRLLAGAFRRLPDSAGRAFMRRHGKRFRNV